MEDKLHWYAMKVFYNKVFEMEDLLEAYGIESYFAETREEQKGHAHSIAASKLAGDDRIIRRKFIQSGPMIFMRRPIISSLMFFRADSAGLALVQDRLFDKAIGKSYGFVYHEAGSKTPSVIPDKQMEDFRTVTKLGGGITALSPDIRFGDRVRITEGPLKGTEGYVKRIGKDRRFLVCIEGVIAIATSYIPLRFMEKVEE